MSMYSEAVANKQNDGVMRVRLTIGDYLDIDTEMRIVTMSTPIATRHIAIDGPYNGSGITAEEAVLNCLKRRTDPNSGSLEATA